MSPQKSFPKRWWIVPVMVAVGLAGAFLSFMIIQPQYKATCGLFVAYAAGTSPSDAYAAAQVSQQRVASYIRFDPRGSRIGGRHPISGP